MAGRQKQILESVKRESRITTGLCAGLINAAQDTAIRELEELGSIKKKGIDRSIYYTLLCGANELQKIKMINVAVVRHKFIKKQLMQVYQL